MLCTFTHPEVVHVVALCAVLVSKRKCAARNINACGDIRKEVVESHPRADLCVYANVFAYLVSF